MKENEPEHINEVNETPNNKRMRTNILNKSKFLNEEQRTIVLDYMNNDDNITKIMELLSHRRVTYVQKQLLDQHDIHLSFNMTQKLLKGLNAFSE